MDTTPPIVISASIAIDRLMKFSGTYTDLIQPDKLDTLSISVFLDELIEAHGGVGANIAYSLALLGEHPVLLGSVGENASNYMTKLRNVGVDISYLFTSRLPTATFNVITDQNQSQIGGFYPGAMFDSDDLDLTPWKTASPIVLVGPHDPKAMKRQVNQCREWGLTLCYDIGQQVSNLLIEDMIEGVKAAHILILNEYELSLLSKKIGWSENKIKQTVPLVITTLGKNGSLIEGKDVPEAIKVGIATPDRQADPTGAGDAFRSGFFYGYIRQWPLKACAQLGAVTGSFALEHDGTQNHHFTVAEVTERYEASFHESLET